MGELSPELVFTAVAVLVLWIAVLTREIRVLRERDSQLDTRVRVLEAIIADCGLLHTLPEEIA